MIVNEIIRQQFLVADQPGNHRRSKHINTPIYFVRDAVLNGDVKVIYISVVERLTKPIYNIMYHNVNVEDFIDGYTMS